MSKTQPWAVDTARSIVIAATSTCLATSFLLAGAASAADQNPAPNKTKTIKTVFYIDMENHNWTQPANDPNAPEQIFGNPAAPYINSLVTQGNANAKEVSYCTAYHNVLATASGNNPSIHPSEPNYIWQENGSNLGISDDNDPYAATNPAVPAIQGLFSREHQRQWSEPKRATGGTWHSLEGLSGRHQPVEYGRG